MNIANSSHLVAVCKCYVLKLYMAFYCIQIQFGCALFIFNVYVLVQYFKNALSRSLRLRVIVNMEPKSPHRTDNEPDQAEKSNEISERKLPFNDESSPNCEQHSYTNRSQQLHHRKKLAPQRRRKDLIIFVTLITVRKLLHLMRFTCKRLDSAHSGHIFLDSGRERA
ncbi:hypothetical protein D3C77_454960 [compost metagenome]